MSINLQLPKLTDLKPRITVFGVGGAGGNAVNNMIASGLGGVEYVVANTDAQALAGSSAERRVQLGINLTEGLGAGSKPEIGEAAAEEAIDEIKGHIVGAHMVFIAAGMGGGTGTGAASVIARIARDQGVLTVGIVTKPFQFEGTRRMRIAEAGIAELKKYVDTLIVIPNQNLFRVANEKTTFSEAFILADQVLYSGIACIVDLIVKEGLINLDFADVRTVMSGMGTAMMGTGEASGERRAMRAAEEAIANPLLDEVSLKGAKGLLLSIIGGRDMTLYEVDEAATRVRQEVDPDANIIVGATFDDNMGDRVRVAIVASGLAGSPAALSGPLSRLQQPLRAAAQVQPPPTAQPAMTTASQPAHAAPMRSAQPGFAPVSDPSRPSGANAHPFAQGQPPNREIWRAPGDVVIEEGLPPLANNGPARTQPPPLDQARPTGAFKPAQPEDFQRSPRRMPEVDDFPAVGQREYRAKANQYGAPSGPDLPVPPGAPPRIFDERPEPQPARRTGLFQRLVGSGLGRGGQDNRQNAPPQRAIGDVHDKNQDSRRAGEAPQLPYFFNRDKG